MSSNRPGPSRREFVQTGLGCAAWIAAGGGRLGGLSGHAFAAQARGRVVGSDLYLTKPFTKEELLAAVAQHAAN